MSAEGARRDPRGYGPEVVTAGPDVDAVERSREGKRIPVRRG